MVLRFEIKISCFRTDTSCKSAKSEQVFDGGSDGDGDGDGGGGGG